MLAILFSSSEKFSFLKGKKKEESWWILDK